MWEQIHGLVVQSSNRIISGVANFLPGVLALIVILLITLLMTVVVRVVLRRFLRSVDFDGIVSRWGFPDLAEWLPSQSPGLMAIRIVNGCWVLLGTLLGIYVFDAELTSRLVARLFDYIPHVIAAVIVLAVGTFAARFLARSVLISAVNLKIHSAKRVSVG